MSDALCKAVGEFLSHLTESGVEDRGILPFHEAHGADLAGDGDVDVIAQYFSRYFRGTELIVIPYRGEHAGDGDGPHTLFLHLLAEVPAGILVQRRQLAAVELEASADDNGPFADGLDVVGPVDHRKDAAGRRGSYPHEADLRQVLSLDYGVGALGCAQHRLADLLPVDAGLIQDLLNCPDNALVDITGRGVLHARHNIVILVYDNGIRVGAAYIYSKLVHYRIPPFPLTSTGT